ncbi:3-deoxy-D-manno-octulosonic acid transferase [Desulfoluna spongiiphila]|uniref:3-deoxy-D-manno-octulosonic acid transferase n=1 Tax=Desulfoluna spongiiphila TaxID=419481 RepID=A0A1G5AI21_9BACT|nr:glycosyltransferase N-terminal domain-containing protein [Desulfoluna spongiiphila]SCX77510.1 3-deoxy-D-manno-octulosonic-acid transferase [Desulfoluna spongiiphila]
MTLSRFVTGLTLSAYNLLWKAAVPLTRNHKRLKEGYDQRTLMENRLTPSDIWIHAASAGEAYIAAELVAELSGPEAPSILISTHTRQGLEVLEKRLADIEAPRATACYAPFDAPSLMDKAFQQVAPRLLVLVELELWPGMLAAAKKHGTTVAIVNGRLTPSSFKGYARAKGLLAPLAPDFISAISPEDAQRLSRLFPSTPVEVIPNIKFDRIPSLDEPAAPVPSLFPGAEARTIYLLASVREEEEDAVADMCREILARDKSALIAWFPRHMERVEPLCLYLEARHLAPAKRSCCRSLDTATSLIVWDRFGEMGGAFSCARAAFVGGSFADLGGQNMLEPLAAGLIPVMGPSYSNFAWVGDDLRNAGLLILCTTTGEAAEHLVRLAREPRGDNKILKRFESLIATRRGGTAATCKHLTRLAGL